MSKSTSDRKSAIKYSDKQFSLFVKARDKRCVTCGADGSDCSHVFRRGRYATRWDVRNAYFQCRSCHFKHHNGSEWPLLRYAQERLGEAGINSLEADSKRLTKFTATQIKALGDDLRALYEGL